MWWRFRRHRVAVVSGALLLAFYLIILFCEFLAPYGLDSRHTDFIYAPPQGVRLFDESGLRAPFVLGYDYRLDMTNLHRVYTPDPAKHQPIRWLCHGDPYKFWGYIDGHVHLACPAAGGQMFLRGSDRLGRGPLARLNSRPLLPLTGWLIATSVPLPL